MDNAVIPHVKKGAKHAPDYILMISTLMLVCLGLLMVYSASYFRGDTSEGSGDFYFSKQLTLAIVGSVVALFICYFFNYRAFRDLPWLRYTAIVVGVLAPLLVYVPGIGAEEGVNGATRWIYLFGISIQPSELSKFAIIVFMAGEIGAHPEKLKDLQRGVLPHLGVLLVLSVTLYMMPNFSAIICIALLVFCLLLVGGVSNKFLIGVAVFGVIAILAFVALEPYRVGRLIALSDPFSDSTESAYQLRQSLYSVSSGGLFGRGLGQSMQKLAYLPLPESDFIFAIICEELGFFGGMFTLITYAVFVWRGILVALRAVDLTGTLMATGVVAIVAFQVVIIIGVVLGVLPTSGVVLPFISYGGSAIIVFLGLVGMLLNVSRQTVRAVKVSPEVYEKHMNATPPAHIKRIPSHNAAHSTGYSRMYPDKHATRSRH